MEMSVPRSSDLPSEIHRAVVLLDRARRILGGCVNLLREVGEISDEQADEMLRILAGEAVSGGPAGEANAEGPAGSFLEGSRDIAGESPSPKQGRRARDRGRARRGEMEDDSQAGHDGEAR